jgi:hypothetical protein
MISISCKPQQERLKAESILSFDWRTLTELGVSSEEARSIAQHLILRRLMSVYWQRLLNVGVPRDNARRIARSVAKFDVIEQLPTSQQQSLIRQYCPAVCRAGLWRAELLLRSRS